MKKSFLLLLMAAFCSVITAQIPVNVYWQQRVDYNISATLDDKENTLDAFESFTYHNQSPDTLEFLWIHLWPNAYKNDKTAYSEQKLTNDETDFYFSGEEEKGYINRVDFKWKGSSLIIEDHPQYIDVVKIILPRQLLPGDSITIETPFHVKIPYRFSRMGYVDQHYSLTQWYPKVAAYDKDGWHEMPYLEWGEYYNDFGNYKIQIRLPANYVVGATGVLESNSEKDWLKAQNAAPVPEKVDLKKKELFSTRKLAAPKIISSPEIKTLVYHAENVTDFAWFADKSFLVKYDTIQLNGRTIEAWNFVLPSQEKKWQNSMEYTKNAIRFYSAELGDYAYPQVTVVCDPLEDYDGMEYPMITILNTGIEPEKELDIIIAHEIGHNWLQAVIATNERQHAWMDEGINTYVENKYRSYYYPISPHPKNFLYKKFPVGEAELLSAQLYSVLSRHTDQPADLPSEKYTFENYNACVYTKTGLWMDKLEKQLGSVKMHGLLAEYYRQWQFKHPQPEDFKKLAEDKAGNNLEDLFSLLKKTGPLDTPSKREVALTGLFNFSNQLKKTYIGIAPAFGFNNYDKVEMGLLVHNYNLNANKFQFVASPMFATGSKQLVGYGRASYDLFPEGRLQRIQLYAGAAKFTTGNGTGIDDEKLYKGFAKLTPGILLEWKKKTATSATRKWIDIRSYFISEQQLELKPRPAPADTVFYATKAGSSSTIIPQVTAAIEADRELYPWSVALSVQQVKQVVRTTVTAHYFLNYNEGEQGLAVRFFMGKIFYTESKTDLLRSENSRYHFTMYGPNGEQDYTYSNAFAERNQSTDLAGRQIMIRDGGFKYRSDYSSVQPGLKTNGIDFFDNWLASVNITLDIPAKLNPLSVLPIKIPLKIFADAGTSASPWQANSGLPKFLYSAGLQLSLFRVLNIYYPLVESEAFKEPNSVNDPSKAGGPNWWQKHLTFSFSLVPLRKQTASFLFL